MDADLPTLDWLSGVLSAHADTIGKLKVTAQITMPGSPTEAVTSTLADAAAKAFGLIGRQYQQMAEATKTTRSSYEELDTEFAAQLRRYTDGTMPR
ncbi:hypothetical protein [Nocardia nova]|uniref:hypothetical protein n=1 Tax=Nocardia nova TaxID=37330 RepID=UPI0033C8B987